MYRVKFTGDERELRLSGKVKFTLTAETGISETEYKCTIRDGRLIFHRPDSRPDCCQKYWQLVKEDDPELPELRHYLEQILPEILAHEFVLAQKIQVLLGCRGKSPWDQPTAMVPVQSRIGMLLARIQKFFRSVRKDA